MTRKEAAEIVEKYIELYEGGAAIYEALKMAVDALKDENALLDEVFEIIEELNDTKALVKATPLGSYLHKTYARRLKEAVKELAGEGTDGND